MICAALIITLATFAAAGNVEQFKDNCWVCTDMNNFYCEPDNRCYDNPKSTNNPGGDTCAHPWIF